MSVITNLKKVMTEKEPEVFGTLGIIGGVLAVGFAIGGTVLAYKAIEKKKEEKKANILKAKTEAAQNDGEVVTDITVTDEETKLTKSETVKTIWKYYIPVVVIGGAAIYCSVRSTHAYASKLVTLTAAYKLSEKTRTEYMTKVKEMLGERETQKIQDGLSQQRVDDNPPDENCLQHTGNGETLCREELTGRYFYSSKQAIQDAINKLNYDAMTNMWVSVNDLFDQMELDEVSLGEDLGWSIENGLIDPVYSSALTPNGTPVVVVDFRILPTPRPKYT